MSVVRKHGSSWEFLLRDTTGHLVAEISLPRWRENGLMTVEGLDFDVVGSGWDNRRSPFIVSRYGSTLAKGIETSAGSEFVVNFDYGAEYWLRTQAWPLLELIRALGGTPTYHVFVRDRDLSDRKLGSISSASWFGSYADLDLPHDLPLRVKTLVTLLVLLSWARELP
jgi:hypothetical protein